MSTRFRDKGAKSNLGNVHREYKYSINASHHSVKVDERMVVFFSSYSLSTTIEAGNQTLLGPAQKMQIAGFWFHNKERTGTSLCVPLSRDGLRQTTRLFPLQSEFSGIDSAPVRRESAASKAAFSPRPRKNRRHFAETKQILPHNCWSVCACVCVCT